MNSLELKSKEQVIQLKTPRDQFGKLRWLWVILLFLILLIGLSQFFNKEEQFFEIFIKQYKIFLAIFFIYLFLLFFFIERTIFITNQRFACFYQFFQKKYFVRTWPFNDYKSVYYDYSKNAKTYFFLFFPKKYFYRLLIFSLQNVSKETVNNVLFDDNEIFKELNFSLFNNMNAELIPLTKKYLVGRAHKTFRSDDFDFLSQLHLSLEPVNEKLILIDHQSKNGTKVNQKFIPALKKIELKDGDNLEFGKNNFIIKQRWIITPPKRLNFFQLIIYVLLRPIMLPIVGFTLLCLYPFEIPNCAMGDRKSCLQEARSYYVTGEFSRAEEILSPLCRENYFETKWSRSSCYKLAEMAYAENDEKNFYQYITKAARKTHPLAQLILAGMNYNVDEWVPRLLYFQSLCGKKNPMACFQLALAYSLQKNFERTNYYLNLSLEYNFQDFFTLATHPFLKDFRQNVLYDLLYEKIEKENFQSIFDYNQKKGKGHFQFIKMKYLKDYFPTNVEKTCSDLSLYQCFSQFQQKLSDVITEFPIEEVIQVSDLTTGLTNHTFIQEKPFEKLIVSYENHLFILGIITKKTFKNPLEALRMYDKNYELKMALLNEHKKIEQGLFKKELGALNNDDLALKERFEKNEKNFNELKQVHLTETITHKVKKFPFLILLFSKCLEFYFFFQ